MPRVTSRDVGVAAGVSQATVSLVLSGKAEGRVSREKADAVRAAAARLGYRPNAAARALRTGATRTVGLVVPDGTNPFFGRLLRGVQGAARLEGYAVGMIDAGRQRAWEVDAIEVLQAGPADGLALYGTEPPAGEDGGPIVLIDQPHRRLPTVRLDHHEGGRLQGAHLRALGHRDVAHLAFAVRRPLFEDRSRGLAEGLGDGARLETEPTRFAFEDARRALHDVLERAPGVTAVVCDDDLIAGGARTALRERGARVPEDVSLVGYDDVDLAAALDPPLTTVRIDAAALGAAVFDVLHRVITDREPPRDTVLPVELVVRGSTGPPRALR